MINAKPPYFWDRKAMMVGAGDYTEAEITQLFQVSSTRQP
jgi:hypothetical protein